MKKLFLLLSLFFSLSISAQEMVGYTTQLQVQENGIWKHIDKGENIRVEYYESKLIIYSYKVQVFEFLFVEEQIDKPNYQSMKFGALDNDGCICSVRFLCRDRNYYQIYIDYYNGYYYAYDIKWLL